MQLLSPGAVEVPADVPASDLATLSSHEVMLDYRIDPTWLHADGRAFPVTLDPTACIGYQAAGCTINTKVWQPGSGSPVAFEWFLNSGGATPVGWTVMRSGYDAQSGDGGFYGAMRMLYYFPDTALPDGAQITKATLRLEPGQIYGSPGGHPITAYASNKAWTNSNATTWSTNGSAYDSSLASTAQSTTSYAVGSPVTWTVTGIAQAWYTRRLADWTPPLGFLLRFDTESSSYGEVDWRKTGSTTTSTSSPLLTLTYVIPAVSFSFDTALGDNYAPSTMVAGQTTQLPITLRNDTDQFPDTAHPASQGYASYTFNHAADSAGWSYEVGWRWFDASGGVVACPGSCTLGLTADLAAGSSASKTLSITAPSTPGQYTLRLDLVHANTDGTLLWSSDWASPSMYLSRDKRTSGQIGDPADTRWVGSSVIERDEFGIAVSDGSGTSSGDLTSVALGDGGSLGINLASRNLQYANDTGLGFSDLMHLGLTYGYNRAVANACDNTEWKGIIHACGWYTNWDERLTDAGGGSYLYQGPDGNTYTVGTGTTSILSSGAPVLLERQRVTYLDETTVAASTWSQTAPSWSHTHLTGTYGFKHASNTGYTTTSAVADFSLNTYEQIHFSVYGGSETGAGIGFYVKDLTTGVGNYLFYTLGSGSIPIGSPPYVRIDLGGSISSWNSVSRNMLADVVSSAHLSSIGGSAAASSDSFEVTTLSLVGDTQANLYAYYDAIYATAVTQTRIGGSSNTVPSWSSGSSSTSSDHLTGSESIKITSAYLTSSPSCTTDGSCETASATDLTHDPFVTWTWKKVGGSSAAIQFNVTDTVSGATKWIVYYAGTQPGGVHNSCGLDDAEACAIQVSTTIPSEWTTVRRNLLDDARQLSGVFTDTNTGTDPNAAPTGPIADPAALSSFTVSGVDGAYLLIDNLAQTSAPNAASDASDFVASYVNGEQHRFNADGLLTQITDRNGNATTLDWTVDPSVSGQTAYSLTTIHAPSDGTSLSGGTAQREIDVAVSSLTNHRETTFTERLGSTSSSTGRSASFYVWSNSTASTDPTAGTGDLTMVKPARVTADGCLGTRPTGCAEFSYTNGTNHSLAQVRDPRWNGATSGSADDRHDISYSGGDPVSITDRSHGSAALLRVVRFDASSGGFRRVVYQDAAAAATNTAITEDLTPDGSVLNTYARLTCASSCAFGSDPPSAVGPGTLASAATFDGLARLSDLTTYRCPALGSVISGCTGSTALASVTRRVSYAAAKVDNLPDPLAASEVVWSQNADQYFASVAAGTDDLYATTTTYNDKYEPVDTVAPVANRAGSVASQDLHVSYDTAGRRLQTDDDSFVSNPGFELGLGSGWSNYGSGSENIDTGTYHSGSRSVKLYGSAGATYYQPIGLLPGQTVRLQLWAKASAGSTATAHVLYQRSSDGTYVGLGGSYLSTTSTGWAHLAADVTVPLDGTGMITVDLIVGAGNTAWYDDVSVFSTWTQTAYNANGTVADTYRIDPTSSTGSNRVHVAYAATGSTPAIFPTTVTADYLDGSYDPAHPDQDVAVVTGFDVWGRAVSVSDPDPGVGATTTTYAANQTDVASVVDGAGDTTSYAYDLVGNRTSLQQPAGEMTTATYDLADHPLLSTGPDGVAALDVYDDYGRLVTHYANYVNGSPSGATASDDVTTSYGYDAWGHPTSLTVDDGTFTGALKRKTTDTYDLLGNVVAETVYADSAHTQARTTTYYFETTGSTLTRTSSSGERDPIAPSAGAGVNPPTCPGTSSTYCNTVTSLDLNGRVYKTTDAYGHRTINDRDLAGHLVRSIANYADGLGGASEPDTDVTTQTLYDVAARPLQVTDPHGRITATTYDALGRATQVTYDDTSATAVSKQRTIYTPAGRVDRASALGAVGTADDDLTWTRTLYDAAGRATTTLAHYDPSGDFHERLESFEGGDAGWSAAASGYFTTVAASASLDDAYHAQAPATGSGRLRVSTGSTAGDGVWLDLSGSTFLAGHTYHVHGWFAGWGGASLEVHLGVDSSGGSHAQTSITTLSSWQGFDLSWTPSSTVSSNVHFAVSRPSGGHIQFYLDDVQIYDTAAADWNIPTTTAYDPDGRVVASVLPPAAAGAAPMVTTTAYDPAGRTVSVTATAADRYQHTVANDGASHGLAGWWPLSEASGTTLADHSGTHTLSLGGGVRLGVAGGVDEARTAAAFDGSSGYASTAAAASSATDNFTLEGWLRLDSAATSRIAAFNGTDSAGWGIGLDSAGKLAALYIAGGTQTWLSTSVAPALGIWHHVGVVRSSGTTTVYLDGTAYTPANASTAPGTPGAGFSLGRQSSSSGRYWPGALAQVAVYGQALSSGTLGGHWSAGRESASDARLTTRTGYDPLGRATERTSPRGIRDVYRLDRLGDVTATIANYVDGSASSASSDDDLQSTFAYDAIGEKLGSCSPAQVYAGGCDPASASNHQAWHYTYDAMGHLVSQVPPVTTSLTALDTTAWTYDAGGQLTSTCDYPAGGSCATNADRHTNFAYDGMLRPTISHLYTGTGSTLVLSTVTDYDVDGNPTLTAFDGSGSSEGSDTLTYTYDAMGRPAQVKRGSTVLSDATWNADGTLASRTDGDAGAFGTTTFGYDWAKRVTSVSNATLVSGSLTSSWNADGTLAGRGWPNGEALSVTYDAAKRATAATYTSAGSFAQTYDRDGNVSSEGRSLAGVSGDAGTGTQSFTYDGLDRLTASSGLATSLGYAYDRDGNRTSVAAGSSTTSYTYDRSDAAISRTDAGTTTSFTYDPFGNLTGSATAVNQVTTYTYDLGDRLTGITPPAGSAASFGFDALGRHRTRVVGSSTDTYAYSGTSDTVAGISSGSVTTASLLDPSGARLANTNLSTGAAAYSLPDLHGNLAAAELASSTTLADAVRYDGYGDTIASGGAGGGPAQPYRYQGRLDISPDASQPLYDFSARSYQPSLGAFTQLDSVSGSVQDPLSLNRYLYAEANPATLIDPSGHYVLRDERQTDLASSRLKSGTGGGSVAPSAKPAPRPGLMSGIDEVPPAQPLGDLGWTLNSVDWYQALDASDQTSFIDAHGYDALQLILDPNRNPFDYPLAYWLARQYAISHYSVDSAEWLARLTAIAANTTVEQQLAARQKWDVGNTFAFVFMGVDMSGLYDAGELGVRSGAAGSLPVRHFAGGEGTGGGAARAVRITFGHGDRHLPAGLSGTEVEDAIRSTIASEVASADASGAFWGRLEVDGTTIEYRAYTLPDGRVNVGTYYPK